MTRFLAAGAAWFCRCASLCIFGVALAACKDSGEPTLPGDEPPPEQTANGGMTGGAVVPGPPRDLDGNPICTRPVAPRAPLRRLTRFEYNNTIQELLGITTRPADALPGEEAGNGFGNDADALSVSRLLVDGYRTIAADAAIQVAGDVRLASALAGCDGSGNETACADKFIANFGLRAYRRPLETRETTALQAMFAKGRENRDFAAGVRAVVERVLQSPQFLYRIETGEPVEGDANLMRPTPHEMASRLSYLLWGSMPDEALMAAAREGKLRAKAEVRAQADRMLADPRARKVMSQFHMLFLGLAGIDNLARAAQAFPSFKPGMGSLFRMETESFIDDVVWSGPGDLATLLSAPYSFLNGALAQFYGIAGVAGDAFRKVDLDPQKRAGFTTHASVLAATTPGSRTNPIVRGKWIYGKLMCQQIPDPPDGIPEAPEIKPGVSIRERLAMHRDSAACRSCHELLDPVGFGLENYDGVGLWRTSDNGVAIDASGEISGTDVAGPFHGGVELAQRLAVSQDVRSCYVAGWFTYGYGRAESDADACTRAALEQAFSKSNGNVLALVTELTQTDAFLYLPAAR